MHRRDDELDRLNEMLRALEKANAEAEHAREEAEKATRAKSDFLASMSHEIRTPINAILGFDEMILRESSDEATRQYALDIRSAGRTLLSIINDILDFSRVESGRMEILPKEYRLHRLISDVSNMISLKAKGKGIYFEQMVDPMVPDALYGDEKRLKQILINILTNAVKYTDIGGAQLHVGFTKTSEDTISLSVSVRDTGRGMRPEDLKRLFSPYERIDEADNSGVEGTGLGMTITKQLLEMMGSHLDVESVFGEGSAFSFEVTQKVTDWEPMGDLDERSRMSEDEQFTVRKQLTAPDAHILVVDDTPINIKVFAALLKQTRIKIDSAESGGDAFKKACRRHYDMMFLDHMMPDMDGIETLELIQSYDASLNTDTPAIMLTANAMAGAREEYLSKGFTDYLTKPLDSVKLEGMLKKYLPEGLVSETDCDTQQDNLSDTAACPAACPDAGMTQAGAASGGPATDDPHDMASLLRNVFGISVAQGTEASGGPEIYEEVIRDFYKTGESRAARIREYLDSEDWENYTIQVHALKSTARLAGAMTLSVRALRLEECGRARDVETIRTETPELLKDYLDLTAQLKERLDKKSDKPVIDDVKLNDAVKSLKESMEHFDLDAADVVMGQLEAYEMPEYFAERYERLKVLMTEVARDEVLELLKGDIRTDD